MAGVTRKGTSHLQTYIAYTKREVQPLEIVTICLKNLSRFFRNFDCVGHLAL